MLTFEEAKAVFAPMRLSPATVRHYAYTMVRLSRIGDPATITQQQLDTYVELYVPRGASSLAQLRAALGRWRRVHGAEQLHVQVPTQRRGTCRALDDEDARRVARRAMTWRSGPEGVAVLLGLYQALRRFEIAKAAWDDVLWDQGLLKVVGKGNVEAVIPLHPLMRDKLEWWRVSSPYLLTRGRTSAKGVVLGPGPIFPGRGKGPVCPNTIDKWVQKIAVRSGVAFTSHQLRHTALAVANDKTGDLRAVQEFARHASPTTTARYTRVREDRLRNVLSAIDFG